MIDISDAELLRRFRSGSPCALQILFERYETGFGADQGDEYIEFMVAKRVAVRVDFDDVVSWDHRKIAG